jgi:hypothetical protein
MAMPSWVEFRFFDRCLASGDDPNQPALSAIAVADKYEPQHRTQSEEDETIFVFRMIGIVNELGAFIMEDGRQFSLPRNSRHAS